MWSCLQATRQASQSNKKPALSNKSPAKSPAKQLRFEVTPNETTIKSPHKSPLKSPAKLQFEVTPTEPTAVNPAPINHAETEAEAASVITPLPNNSGSSNIYVHPQYPEWYFDYRTNQSCKTMWLCVLAIHISNAYVLSAT